MREKSRTPRDWPAARYADSSGVLRTQVSILVCLVYRSVRDEREDQLAMGATDATVRREFLSCALSVPASDALLYA